MSEQAVVTARASVLLYDDAGKQWVPSGSCKQQQEVSRVQLFHHVQQNTFRVVGRKLQDHEVVVNCSVGRGFKYNITSDTFHQWKDQQVLYGLNFLSHEDANSFGTAMIKVIEVINSSPCGLVQQGARPPAAVCRLPGTASSSRPVANGSDCYDDRNSVYAQGRRTVAEGANGNVYASAGYAAATPTTSCGSVQPAMNVGQKPTVGGQVPPAPPIPPSLSATNAASARRQPSVNGKKPTIASNAPPPPPLPNMGTTRSLCNSSAAAAAAKTTNLADALATAKLRKVSTPATAVDLKNNGSRSASVGSIETAANFGRSSTGGFGHDDVISEITATLAKRKMLQESQQLLLQGNSCNNDVDSDADTVAATAQCRTENVDSKKCFRPVDSNATAPAVHRKVPSGSSLSSQEENAASQAWQRGLTNGHSAVNLNPPGGTDLFDAFKQEIVQCIREEMARVKTELIDSFRTELSRQLKVSDFGQNRLR